MITEYIRYRIDPGAYADFEHAYTAAAKVLAASENCIDYDLSRCHEEPDRYILRICWDSIDGHLEGFRRSPAFREFLSHVGPYVSSLEEMQHYEGTGVAGAGQATGALPSLYEWAGGRAALEALFARFYELVLADPTLRPMFEHMDPHHAQHVATWIGEVFGGPNDYTAHHGGHPEMLRHHLNREISEVQRRRWIELLVDAADEVGLPDDPEFRAAVMGYVEWGTRLAKAFSQPGASPNFDEPVPKWNWAVAPWVPDAS